MRSLRQLHRLEFRNDEAFLAYLRKSIRHRIVDEIRKARRRPVLVPTGRLESVSLGVSPLERVIARSQAQRYRDLLARLRDRDRQLIVLRVEQGLSYADIAAHLGMRTESAARMAIKRAILRLEAKMKRERRSETTRLKRNEGGPAKAGHYAGGPAKGGHDDGGPAEAGHYA